MKILIAGDGKVGKRLTRQLSVEGYDLTIIDIKPQVLEESVDSYDVMALQGNCASMNVLLEAGVKEADLLIAVTSADEVNLLSCMIAHGLNPDIHTIARIRNPEYSEQVFKMRDIFGLSMMVNPEHQAAREIERLLKYPGFLKRDTFVKGRVEMVELRVNAGSQLCNVALSDMYDIIKCKVLVCAVQRGDSRLAYYLASGLIRRGISVKLIEKDHDRCLQLAEALPKASIIEGDATSESLLESEGLEKYDALVAMTGMDELNVIISLYGKQCGVSQVITKIGHLENNKILNSLSLGSIICPKDLCSNTIVRYVRAMKRQAGAALSVHSIADGQLEAVEFVVDDTVICCRKPLKNLKIRKNVLISCITHMGNTMIPRGDSCYDIGDTVIVVTTSGNVLYHLNDIFE